MQGMDCKLLRCMTFNICSGNAEKENDNSWKHRKEMVASIIRFHRVDVAGLQEVLKNQLDDLSRLLPDYAWIGVGRDDGIEKGEFTPLFYLKNRLEVLESGHFWLSKTPDVPGSRSWDAVCRRILTWSKFRDRITEKVFFLFNTHFDHIGFNARRKSAHLLLRKIHEIGEGLPVVVTGDFNCNERSETYSILTDYKNKDTEYRGLRNARLESCYDHHGPTITYHNYNATRIFALMRKFKRLKSALDRFNVEMSLDFIFVKNDVKVLQHAVLADTWDGWYPSDHMPVVADVVIDDAAMNQKSFLSC
ncbi:MAG: endonuclease/exonuclease/phosphatase family protein [Clostridiaceae bacterium]|nr:endonuclease/exonuclease/phosphatase family protein [Clostridiaceae bacterium]